LLGVLFDQELDGAGGDALAGAAGEKDSVGLRLAEIGAVVEPVEKGALGGPVEGDDALFVPLAVDTNLVALEVEVGEIKLGQFTDAQSDVNNRIPTKNPQIRDIFESLTPIIP